MGGVGLFLRMPVLSNAMGVVKHHVIDDVMHFREFGEWSLVGDRYIYSLCLLWSTKAFSCLVFLVQV